MPSAVERIVAITAVDAIGTSEAPHLVIPRSTFAQITQSNVVSEIWIISSFIGSENAVVPIAAAQRISDSTATDQQISTRISIDDIDARSSIELIVSGAATDLVGPFTSKDPAITFVSRRGIVAGASVK